jgi:hypothetical protein
MITLISDIAQPYVAHLLNERKAVSGLRAINQKSGTDAADLPSFGPTTFGTSIATPHLFDRRNRRILTGVRIKIVAVARSANFDLSKDPEL